jgi:hypothetical protein
MSDVFSPTAYYNAGMLATITLTTESVDGYAIDPINPEIAGVFDPNLQSLSGFPIAMSRLGNEVGSFIARFRIPTGLESVGTYLVVVKWVDAESNYERHRIYSLVVGVPFGSNSVIGL